jgi:hypothetical protein
MAEPITGGRRLKPLSNEGRLKPITNEGQFKTIANEGRLSLMPNERCRNSTLIGGAQKAVKREDCSVTVSVSIGSLFWKGDSL